MAKSIILFSMHRSASTFLTGFLKNIAKHSEYQHVFLDPLLETRECNIGKPTRTIPDHLICNFSPVDRIYGPHRRWIDVPSIDDYHVILCLRDPRDVLVSLYFALCYSHDPPRDFRRQEYLDRKRKVLKTGIDRYAVEYSDRLLKVYEAYHSANIEHDMLLLSYEQMVINFPIWLKRFLRRCNLLDLKKRLLRFNKFEPPKRENVCKHKRQISPCDHKRKLKRQTIKTLDNKFGDILNWLKLPRD